MKALIVLPLTLLSLACATKKYVETEAQKVNQDATVRVNNVQKSVEGVQEDIKGLNQKDTQLSAALASTSENAQQARKTAEDAQTLAKGKFNDEPLFTDAKVQFAFDKAELTPQDKAELDAFAAKLKSENKNVYVEIQGHTDDYGNDAYNYQLGERRAEAVKQYLETQDEIAPFRLSVVSYGKEKPQVPNKDRASRAENRSVVLVVVG